MLKQTCNRATLKWTSILASVLFLAVPSPGKAQCCVWDATHTFCLSECADLKPVIDLKPALPRLPRLVLRPVLELPVSAAAHLYISALSKDEVVANLRREAAEELAELRLSLWEVSFEGLTTILSWQGDSQAAEWAAQNARKHLTAYLETLRKIEELTGEQAEAARRYKQRLANLRIHPEGHYFVHTSDSTVISRYAPSETSDTTPQPQKGTHREEYLTIEKVPVKAGFDNNGNAYYKMKYDVVRKEKEVPDK